MVKSDSSDESGDEMVENESEKAQLTSCSENQQSETGSQNDKDDDGQSIASAALSENNEEPDDVIESGDGNFVSSPKGSAEPVDSAGEESDDDEDASENGEDAAGPVRTVVIDEEEQGDDPEADISSKDDTGADESILNKDDFDDGGSTPKSGTGQNDKSPAKKSRTILGSDSDDSDAEKTAEKKPEDVEKLMNNIFGEDSSDEGEGNIKDKEPKDAEDSDDADAKFLRVERDSDDGGHEWDFDAMLKKKKAERRRKHKRKVKALVDQMHEAAAEDRASNQDKRPAIQKRKMLSTLRSTLMKADLFETLLDNGMMSGISEWLAHFRTSPCRLWKFVQPS
uniref:Uncharacterized protein n=1 Tax=Ditylenchus dipsaci TaxID=166011 RepID=A0A915DY65_9BILA